MRQRILVAALLLLITPLGQGRAQPAITSSVSLGDEAYARMDYPEALDFYELAYEAGDRSYYLLNRLSSASNDIAHDHLHDKNRDEAKRRFEGALFYAREMEKLEPDSAHTQFMLAMTVGKLALFEGGKGKVKIGRRVEEYALRAIELDSSYSPPYIVLGVFYREVAKLKWFQKIAATAFFGGVPSGTLEDSARFLEAACGLQPALAGTHWELAKTYLAMKRDEDALAQFRRFVEMEPYNREDARLQLVAQEYIAEHERE
jgi:tetratricopeptide (TPR) repeat protein